MKQVTHNSRSLLKVLDRFIGAACGLQLGVHPWKSSAPKRDGRVVVRFRSHGPDAATELRERFVSALRGQGYEFTVIDDINVGFPLAQLGG